MRQSLCVQNFGPIKNVDVNFGDLTILIGPQASGKSLFLELFKLVKDKAHIVSTLKKYSCYPRYYLPSVSGPTANLVFKRIYKGLCPKLSTNRQSRLQHSYYDNITQQNLYR